MRLVLTMHYAGMAANVGGSVESISHIVEVPDDALPKEVCDYLKSPEKYQYTGLSLSYMRPEPREEA